VNGATAMTAVPFCFFHCDIVLPLLASVQSKKRKGKNRRSNTNALV
jgi:hypothetical protein